MKYENQTEQTEEKTNFFGKVGNWIGDNWKRVVGGVTLAGIVATTPTGCMKAQFGAGVENKAFYDNPTPYVSAEVAGPVGPVWAGLGVQNPIGHKPSAVVYASVPICDLGNGKLSGSVYTLTGVDQDLNPVTNVAQLGAYWTNYRQEASVSPSIFSFKGEDGKWHTGTENVGWTLMAGTKFGNSGFGIKGLLFGPFENLSSEALNWKVFLTVDIPLGSK